MNAKEVLNCQSSQINIHQDFDKLKSQPVDGETLETISDFGTTEGETDVAFN